MIGCDTDAEMNDPDGRSYAVIYAAARDLGYPELEAMAYATEPDLFVADHPELCL